MLPYRKCVVIVLRKSDLVFCAERIDVAGAWQLPQGGVNPREGYAAAAARELEEETGITSINFVRQTENDYFYDFPEDVQEKILQTQGRVKYRGQIAKFVLFDFRGDESEVNLSHDTVEFSQWKWLSPSQILDKIVPFKKTFYQKGFNALGLCLPYFSR
ncbi:MAG: RNA pyrophosphohydrolase [Alphaproteobacteria bacterium]|nr:RNA pyrophosphohydrolase [Alphaproteobacteria bacterium]